jgi:hypothetical protein
MRSVSLKAISASEVEDAEDSARSHVVSITVVKYLSAVAEPAGLVCDLVSAPDRGIRARVPQAWTSWRNAAPRSAASPSVALAGGASPRDELITLASTADIRRVRNMIRLSMELSIAAAVASPRQSHALQNIAPSSSGECDCDHVEDAGHSASNAVALPWPAPAVSTLQMTSSATKREEPLLPSLARPPRSRNIRMRQVLASAETL